VSLASWAAGGDRGHDGQAQAVAVAGCRPVRRRAAGTARTGGRPRADSTGGPLLGHRQVRAARPASLCSPRPSRRPALPPGRVVAQRVCRPGSPRAASISRASPNAAAGGEAPRPTRSPPPGRALLVVGPPAPCPQRPRRSSGLAPVQAPAGLRAQGEHRLDQVLLLRASGQHPPRTRPAATEADRRGSAQRDLDQGPLPGQRGCAAHGEAVWRRTGAARRTSPPAGRAGPFKRSRRVP